jgi:3-hydroxyisobutyrate dehydrogenase-like beta-hydroxyacid dehydrogenase
MQTSLNPGTSRIGWLGVGRMGYAMARRLAEAGFDVTVYNRSREKALPLEQYGVKVARHPTELSACHILFTMLSTGDVVESAVLGSEGIASVKDSQLRLLVDCSSISTDVSARLRASLKAKGVEFLACPISGNPHVVESGNASFVCSGPRSAFDSAEPLLLAMAKSASYVGEGELARVAKICHNVWLGALTQSLAEVVVLGQKAGLTRQAFLDFLNSSALGSVYTRAKTPHWVALDFAATFTPSLMRKDMDLGIDLAHELDVTMPLSTMTRELIQTLINNGDPDLDFSTLLLQQAKADLPPSIGPKGF